jgi:hypothetical protein
MKTFYGIKKNNLEHILGVSVAKRGDLETPTKSAFTLFFSEKEKLSSVFF